MPPIISSAAEMAPALGSRPHTLPRPLPKSATVCQSNFERLPITAVLSLFHQALAQGWWIFKDSWPLTNRSVNCAGPLTQAFFLVFFHHSTHYTIHDGLNLHMRHRRASQPTIKSWADFQHCGGSAVQFQGQLYLITVYWINEHRNGAS